MLMEFVLVMPLLFLLIMGVVQIAHIWTARMVTHYAALCAARATLTMNARQQDEAVQAARQVCAWMAGSDGNGMADVPGWGRIPHSAEVPQRVRVTVAPAMGGAPWLSGATVEFDFPLLIPVAGTMMGYLAKRGSAGTDYKPVSGWTGQFAHRLGRPYITLRETVWLPKPYTTVNYPVAQGTPGF